MVDFPSFDIARVPEIRFGAGRIAELPELASSYGDRVLIVTGAASFVSTDHWTELTKKLAARTVAWRRVSVVDEPSPELVDQAVAEYRVWNPQVVIGIGGGSVLDAAKAIAGLLPVETQVLDHLEGVGKGLAYTGPALPFIAVPTTAGTGSEATKNAVLSVRGATGYKKSFRHDSLVARVALVDPELLASCSFQGMAAQGMDAFTQLLESYLSTRSSPLTDALALSGMEAFRDGFFAALEGRAEGRAKIAYGSLLSGICLAQTGLGSVHGLASPLGALFPIPHGVVCGTLLAEATDINIHALRQSDPASPALSKYAVVGRMLVGAELDDKAACTALVECLRSWVEQLKISKLAEYSVTESDFPRIIAGISEASMRTNPVILGNQELTELLQRRI